MANKNENLALVYHVSYFYFRFALPFTKKKQYEVFRAIHSHNTLNYTKLCTHGLQSEDWKFYLRSMSHSPKMKAVALAYVIRNKYANVTDEY